MYISSVNTWASGDSPLAQLVKELELCVIRRLQVINNFSLRTTKSNIHTTYKLYELTNHMHTNYILNTVPGQGVSMQMPYFIFNKSY